MCQKQKKENINSYRNFLRVLKKIIIRSRVFCENWAWVWNVCFDVPRLRLFQDSNLSDWFHLKMNLNYIIVYSSSV